MKLRNLFRKTPAVIAVVGESSDVLDLTKTDRGDDNNSLELYPVSKSLQRSVDDFPVVRSGISMGDEAAKVVAGDSCFQTLGVSGDVQNLAMNPLQAGWYASQGFIGHQMCAIIAQNWLVGKACAMPAEDALRNGWNIDIQDLESSAASEEMTKKIRALDKRMKLDSVMFEAAKFTNVFGIRILIPIVESTDKEYYRKPFNVDGITAGSFLGWLQIDPQWIYPLLDSVGAGDPNSSNFYEPEFWIAGSVQYHRSHLVIMRTEEPADILKPSYLFSGIPLTQRIAERVYAAERTANEAPLLAMSKRTTALKVDLAKVGLKKQQFINRLLEWINYRDNYNVKVLGKDEELSETDTSLADLDVVIMTQYQLVAAIAGVPATKLLGTSPKGFNATGDHEIKSYHEHLETIQSTWYDQLLDRHYLLLSKAYFKGVSIEHTWLPVDTVGAETEATIQKSKADTAAVYIDKGVISPHEARTRVRLDKDSGFSLPADDEELPKVAEPKGSNGNLTEGLENEAAEVEGNDSLVGEPGITSKNLIQVTALAVAATAATVQEKESIIIDKRRVMSTIRQLAAKLSRPGITATAQPSVKGAVGVKEFSNQTIAESAKTEIIVDTDKPV